MSVGRVINVFLLLLGLGVLTYFILTLDLVELTGQIEQLSLFSIVVVVGITFITVFIKAFRWKYLILKTSKKSISTRFSFFSILTGIAAGSLTPTRAGEVAKPFLLKNRYGIPISETVSCVFSERAFDLLSLILLFFVGFVLLPMDVATYQLAVLAFFVLFLGMVLFLFVFPKRFERLGVFFLTRFAPSKWKEKLLVINHNVFEGFELLKQKDVLGVMIATSLLSMLLEVVRVFFILSWLGISLNFFVVMFAFTGSIVFGLMTFIPGGIGTTEISQAAIISTLVPTFGEMGSLKGAILLDRFFSYYLLIGIGGLVLLFYKRWKL